MSAGNSSDAVQRRFLAAWASESGTPWSGSALARLPLKRLVAIGIMLEAGRHQAGPLRAGR